MNRSERKQFSGAEERLLRRVGFPAAGMALALLLLPCVGFADMVDLGYISFDNLIPAAPGSPGVNGFTIANLAGDTSTGGSEAPPGFPVLTFVTFLNSSLELFSGASTQTVSLGSLGPGIFNPFALQFPDTSTFSSARFTATLDTTGFALDPLAGSGTFTASSNLISVLLQPSSGHALLAGTDFALISVSSQPTAVPEPNHLMLLGTLAVGLWLRRGKTLN